LAAIIAIAGLFRFLFISDLGSHKMTENPKTVGFVLGALGANFIEKQRQSPRPPPRRLDVVDLFGDSDLSKHSTPFKFTTNASGYFVSPRGFEMRVEWDGLYVTVKDLDNNIMYKSDKLPRPFLLRDLY
jgi:hypothetical protein